MKESAADILKNWLPYKLEEDQCRWLYTGDTKFIHPFFDETISQCRRDPVNRHPQRPFSDLDIMKEWSQQIDCAPVKALIFHVSRCGSTLLAQQLSLDEKNIALSEVPFLDELLRWGFRKKQEKKAAEYFLAALRFYSAKRNGNETSVFIKTDSWHLHFYGQLRQLFPTIPFIILIRRPDEIIRSQNKLPGLQSVPGLIEPELFGLDPAQLHVAEHSKHMAEVLCSYYRAIKRILTVDDNILLCDYANGMDKAFDRMVSMIDLQADTELLKRMKERASFHAKKPTEYFEEAYAEEPITGYLTEAMKLYQEILLMHPF